MPPRREGFQTVTIGGRDGELQATFAPGAGMVCCSLRHRGDELLAQRDGVRAYAERGKTMGIPLLYPWANRLAGFGYPTAHGEVRLSPDDPLLMHDEHGLPIHGVLPGALPWELEEGDSGGERLRARLRWRSPELLAIFPYEHELELSVSVAGVTLLVETRVRASGREGVPVSFGFHPYLSLGDCDRRGWEIELPVSRRLALDERMIPTGASEPFDDRRFVLGDGAWDDAFAGVTEPPVFRVGADADGARKAPARAIELELRGGFPYAQLYAPAGESFVCFEPMTAPTNALRSGHSLPHAGAGELFSAAFAIVVGPGA
ncbi:MAG TPA: aldose 1-epimerase [Solirubrobacteraceae bacterium]